MLNQSTPIARFTTQPPLGGDNAAPLENFAILRDSAQQMIGFAVSESEVTGVLNSLEYDAERHQLWLATEGKHHFTDTRDLPTDALRSLHQCCESGLPLIVFSLPVIDDETEISKQTTHQG